MRFSLQVHYAICGVFDLAYNGQGRAVQVRVVGERQGIPTRYLEQIFQRLRRANLVQAKRGPGGGYRLARSPREISILDIVEAVEGPLESRDPTLVEEAGESGRDAASGEGGGSGRSAGGGRYRPDFYWRELAQQMSGVLAQSTVEGLCQAAAAGAVRRANDENYIYEI